MDKTNRPLLATSFNNNSLKLLSGSVIIVYLLLLLSTAWICDDAYITFRTVDNFINGLGLRWNISERVQSYTHPLWMFLNSAVYYFTKEIFFSSIILSIIISLLSIYLILFKLTNNFINTVIVSFLIIFSKTFLDYSTSGLENPLSYLIITILFVIYFKKENEGKINFLLGFISSLLLLNRTDLIILILPILIRTFIKANSKDKLLILFGFSPFVIWEIFSLLYYGFPFPNTAYAKLQTGISRSELISEGLYYFKESLALDPVTIVSILIAQVLVIIKKDRALILLSLGVILYILYSFLIGGDFMAGRFYTVPFLISIIIFSKIEYLKNIEIIFSISLIILFGVISFYRTISAEQFIAWRYLVPFDSDSIKDEREFYFQESSLIYAIKYNKEMPSYVTAEKGKQVRKQRIPFLISGNIGFLGYFSGPDCYILDMYALSDPLRSRLPSKTPWRIGHFPRELPEGYFESILSNENKIKEPNLKKYYDVIKNITRDEIFNFDRILNIIRINLGLYNYLLDNYTSKTSKL